MTDKIIVDFEDGRKISVPYGTTAIDAVKMVEDNVEDILALTVNNEVKFQKYELIKDSTIGFVKIDTEDGYRVYSKSLKMVLYMAITQLFGNQIVDFQSTINRNQYFIMPEFDLTNEKIAQIKERMQEIIDKNLTIEKRAMSVDEATMYYQKSGDVDKLQNMANRIKSYTNVYFCDGLYNNFYGVLVPSTGYLKTFDLRPFRDGALLVTADRDGNISSIRDSKLIDAVEEFYKFKRILGIPNIGALNDKILKNNMLDTIQVAEAIHQRKIVEIVQDIEKKKEIKLILIAGPSSSGKTTFAQKLGVQLRLTGYNPITISMDNYFKERADTPKGPDGKYDFETVDALDIELFNNQMNSLINGETVELPEFDFLTGTKKYNGKFLTLKQKDVLVVEGIHALNPILTKFTPAKNKYKIYIAPITTLNLDSYTKVSSSDTRFLRRMVRDFATRGHSVERTFELWGNVKKGEEKYIFPYVEDVDVIFNSSIIYEPAVIKTFAQPLLLQLDKSSKYYAEARRLYEYLNNFLPMETSNIPIDSLLREFIGNGCFSR
ncbi:MAG: nucleoside kinase [Clostridia bacterium]|nr:nucleoside kinase [Clostridia bacterium]